MTRQPPRLLQLQIREDETVPDEGMIRCAPDFQSDTEYHAWLDMIHQEIKNEGENDADYRQERED